MTALKHVSTPALIAHRGEVEHNRRALDWVYAETDRLSAEAQMELARVRRSLRLQDDAIAAELAIREQMMPTPLAAD